MYNRYQKLPIDIDLDHNYKRHYVKVGTYDKIKVCKLYSHCMPIQFMHTCLIISLHGVEFADKYMCICNNGEYLKPPMHASLQYVTMVARLRDFVA